MEAAGNLLRISKGKGKSHSYKCFISRDTAEKLKLKEKDGLLLNTGNLTFPTVFHKHKTAKSFTYAFTVPRNIGDMQKTKVLRFEITRVAKRERIVSKPKKGIDLLRNIANKTMQGQPFYLFDLGEKTYAWVFSRGSKGFLLNRFIPFKLDKNFDFFEVMGAFHCEGKKARKTGKRNLDSITFSNGDPAQILWFAKSLEGFGFTKNEFRLQILHNEKQKVDVLRRYWGLNFPKERIRFYLNNTVKSEKGICILSVIGTTAGELFYELLKIAERMAATKDDYAVSFFRGLSRGDLGVSRSGGLIGGVNFTSEKREGTELFKRVCEKIGVSTGGEYFQKGIKGFWTVQVFGIENYRMLLKKRAIAHSKRKEKLVNLFLKMKGNRFCEYLKAVNGGAMTSRQVSKACSVSIISSRAFLQKLRENKYLKGKLRNNTLVHTLTEKGDRELAVYTSIEKQAVN